MLHQLKRVPIRIVVTGSRGKSSLTRLIHSGLTGGGLRAYARITGVLPRELNPQGERTISRHASANIREILWWSSQIPSDAQAVVAENSAVAPHLQGYAADILAPTLIVWTNIRPDHTEVWGPGLEGAAEALFKGIPSGVPIVGGEELNTPPLVKMLKLNGNSLTTTTTFFREGKMEGPLPFGGHHEENMLLARLALQVCQEQGKMPLDLSKAFEAMEKLLPDIADFCILSQQGYCLASAFSANDTESTEQLFRETGWQSNETTLLYHHRPDRPARLKEFASWLKKFTWKELVFTRSAVPFFQFGTTVEWNDSIFSPESFRNWLKGRGRVFACGNVAGWPLDFLREQKGLP